MSAHDESLPSLPPLRWGLTSLRTDGAAPQLRWLWQGYLAAGAVTLLTSQWKIGKTTLLALVLAPRHGCTDVRCPIPAIIAPSGVPASEESNGFLPWVARKRLGTSEPRRLE